MTARGMRTFIIRSAVFVILLVTVHGSALAQKRGLAIGDRVKVVHQYEYPGAVHPILRERSTIGRLDARDTTALTVASGNGQRTTIPLVDVQTLGISAGKSPGKGGAIGAFFGAVAGFAVALVLEASQDTDQANSDKNYWAGAAGGAAAGFVIGCAIGVERWDDYPPRLLFDDNRKASLVPAEGGPR